MPKYTVAKYLYCGQFEYLIRLHINSKTLADPTYRTWYLSKKDYTLDEAKLFRNARMAELEKLGLRGSGRQIEMSHTIGMK